MKNHENSTPGSSERYSVEGLWFDPGFREFLDGPVAEAQAKLTNCESPEDMDDILQELYEIWANAYPWLGSRATISGKVRALNLDDDVRVEEAMRKLGYKPKTRDGEDYFEVENLEVFVSYFDVQYRDDEPVMPPQIGLPLLLTDEDWASGLIIFPDEISSVQFETPSIKAIEARMGVEGSGELVERIHSALDNLNGDTAKTLEQLKTLRFSAAEFPEAAKFFHEVGLVAYSCCDFDEGEYGVQISGEVFTYDDEGGFTSATLDEPIDVTAPICGVQFLPQDGGIYQPALVFAVKTAAYGDSADYVSYIVPLENIANLSRFERLALKFGRAALALGSPMELSEHAAELAANARTNDTVQKEIDDSSAAPEIDEIPEQTYDKERNVFFVSVKQDLERLQESLNLHLEKLKIFNGKNNFSDDDIQNVENFINEKDVPRLERLKLCESVRVSGENVALAPLGDGVVLTIDNDFVCEGKFGGVKIIATEKGRASLRRSTKEESSGSPTFAIILEDCQVSGQSEPFDAILHCAPGHFPKLEAIEPASL